MLTCSQHKLTLQWCLEQILFVFLYHFVSWVLRTKDNKESISGVDQPGDGRSEPSLVLVSSHQKISRDKKSWDSVFFSFILGTPAFSHSPSSVQTQGGATMSWGWGSSRQNFPVPPLFIAVKKWVPREAVIDSHTLGLEGQSIVISRWAGM